jgi:hypothetical protein
MEFNSLVFICQSIGERRKPMSPVNEETLNHGLTAMQTYIERKVAKDPLLPPHQKNSLENNERIEKCEAFAELVDSRMEGRRTYEIWESWD